MKDSAEAIPNKVNTPRVYEVGEHAVHANFPQNLSQTSPTFLTVSFQKRNTKDLLSKFVCVI